MLLSTEHLLSSRVNTFLGTLFLCSWALGAALLVWHASFESDPLTAAFAKSVGQETSLLP